MYDAGECATLLNGKFAGFVRLLSIIGLWNDCILTHHITRDSDNIKDFPTVLDGADAEKVGFTSLASEMCFSPVKNATSDGVALQAKGTHPGVAATGKTICCVSRPCSFLG